MNHVHLVQKEPSAAEEEAAGAEEGRLVSDGRNSLTDGLDESASPNFDPRFLEKFVPGAPLSLSSSCCP